MARRRWLDIIFYLILAVVLVWAILKSVGIIQSPVFTEMIPVYGIVFGAGIAYWELRTVRKDVDGLKVESKEVKERVIKLEGKAETTEKTLLQVNERIKIIETLSRKKR